jgi:glycosyltransferase involved in cell wall biosynthesis
MVHPRGPATRRQAGHTANESTSWVSRYPADGIAARISMKLLTVIVPAYNSEEYLARCLDSLVAARDERTEVLIVDDGSSDRTGAIADLYQSTDPDVFRALHQENRGHGGAINTGLDHASGLYLKVVDSDDWVDADALRTLVQALAGLAHADHPVDLVVTNFVYEKSGAWHKKRMRYRSALPQNRVLTWVDIGPFRLGKYLMAHSLCYRTQVLRDCGFQLPDHTFYVDNLIVLAPLSRVHRIFYLDVDLYHYFIGRADQSVHESVMIRRLDQQMKVNRMLVDYWRINSAANENRREYTYHHLEIVTAVSSFLAIRSGTDANLAKKKELWDYLRQVDQTLFHRLRRGFPGVLVNLPGRVGRLVPQLVYSIAQMFFGFN